ncbi:MAG TPA: YdcF family protein [Rudaea sp.]|nr:YdcF family protein [Rudaea sp.]
MLFFPLGAALLLGFALALGGRRLPRALRFSLTFVELLLILAMTPLGANALVWQVESRVPDPDACTAPLPQAIVVLSAGFDRAPTSETDFAALAGDSLKRTIAGVELWRRAPQSELVFAGGGPFGIAESALLARYAEQLGVPAASIRREERSQTTWENAEQLHASTPALPSRIWLVSSALHLPRASLAFRANGFDPCLYASDRRYLPPGGLGYFLPQASALAKAEAAIHELVGEVAYRLRAASGS